MGLDNSGYLVFDVDIEMEPKTYNTSNSNLWTKVRRVFKDELAQMYRDMRASTFKEENLFNILIGEQIDKIPESLYNEDSERKYIKNPKYLHMLHGNRREHMKKWITERLLYLDSQFGYEKNTSESIIIRANKKGRVELNIKTYSPMFVKVRWRNDSTSTEIKKVGRNETVTFVGDLPTETDQEIAIYGAKHIKEIGDISHMTPSSLTLGNATRLTKIECRNSPNLKAIGLGGVGSEDGGRLKNIQLIDLTGCKKLGQDTSSAELNVSYCDNLKKLKLHNTNLKSVTVNIEGGNLEEMYLPNSLTSLYLANQYNLRKVEFPGHDCASVSHHTQVYKNGSQITDLQIINCPKLTAFGIDREKRPVDLKTVPNYRGVTLYNQPNDFDISKEDYTQAFTLTLFGKLEHVNITNSLLNYKYYNINASPSLRSVSFSNMPELKGLILTGNRTYMSTEYSLEADAMFEGISVNNCKNFDTLILQRNNNYYAQTYKFKKDFVWDLSNLPLKRFICSIALQNVKKIILPDTIKEFSHSDTIVYGNPSFGTTATGDRVWLETSDAPLKTIVVKGHYTEDFQGIDLADIPLKNVSFNGLTQRVDMIKNIDCEAIDLNPRVTFGKELDNIKINLNNYKGESFNSFFYGADVSKVKITLDKELTTENMDYSYMFQNAKNVYWEHIGDFIEKLPKGKFYKTFEGCDIDRLEVGHMIGSTTVDMTNCFYNMSKVQYIDVTGADVENVEKFDTTFAATRELRTIVGLNEWNTDKMRARAYMFNGCGIERLDISNWPYFLTNEFIGRCPNITYLKTKVNFNTWTLLIASNPDISEVIFVNDTPQEVRLNSYTFPEAKGQVECVFTLINTIIVASAPQSGLRDRNFTVASLLNILDALKDFSESDDDSEEHILYLGKDNLKKLNEQQLQIAIDKKWTVV